MKTLLLSISRSIRNTMHKKRPTICTCCRVSEAKIYLYHSTKIAKARPHRVECPTDSSVQKQWFMGKVMTERLIDLYSWKLHRLWRGLHLYVFSKMQILQFLHRQFSRGVTWRKLCSIQEQSPTVSNEKCHICFYNFGIAYWISR